MFTEADFLIEEKWCSGQDSNLHALRHTPLKRVCLPIPPPEQKVEGRRTKRDRNSRVQHRNGRGPRKPTGRPPRASEPLAGGETLGERRGEEGTTVDHPRVNLDQGGARIELLGGAGDIGDPADPDER